MRNQALTALVAFPLALASPLQILAPRAGAPAAKPIGPSCTLHSMTPKGDMYDVSGPQSYVFDNTNSSPSSGFSPSTSFRGANTVYSYFLEDDSSQPGWNESAKVQQCLEQCHGYGEPCLGIAWGHHVWGEAYGVTVSSLACLFMGQSMAHTDLVPVTNGSWTRALAINILCPNP